MPTAPNEPWAMDFVHDTLAGCGTVQVLSVLDIYTRECLALVPRRRFPGPEVVKVLAGIGTSRGLQKRISVDNGTEFTSKTLDHWAYWNGVELDFSRPGKPTDNRHVEILHGTLRRECLSQHWFLDLEDTRRTLDSWREDYNNCRPHTSLDDQPPAEYAAREQPPSD